MLAFPCASLRSSALPRGPILLRPGFLPGLRGELLDRSARQERGESSGASFATGAEIGLCVEPSLLGSVARSGASSATGFGFALRASASPVALASLSALASFRSWPASRPTRHTSRTRQEAGSKEPGAPRERRGAELDQGESEHVRAQGCASCAAALIRRAPQGTPCARRTRGADAGWLSLGDFSLASQREVTRPLGRNAVAPDLEAKDNERQASARANHQFPITFNNRRRSPPPQGAPLACAGEPTSTSPLRPM